MSAVRRCRTDLELSTSDILVLDTLLSFLPCRDRKTGADRPITPDMMLVVYASNASLCERANGMDERVLRRHISRLVGAGLLARRDSATGKRFPLRKGGRVTSAYGLDLSPLLYCNVDLQARADQLAADAEDARTARAEALSIRAELLKSPAHLCDEARYFVERAKTILRRKTLTLKDIREILARLARLVLGQDPVVAPEARASEQGEQTDSESPPETGKTSGT